MAQKELYSSGNLYKTIEITQKNPDNLLGKYANFEVFEFTGTRKTFPEGVARSYYFEADNEGQVIIEEYESGSWQTLVTVALTAETMTAYKGLLTPTTTGNAIRLNFDGTTYYKYQNVAMFAEPFKSNQIPTYTPWLEVLMPDDFRMLDAVVEEYPQRNYSNSITYKWESYKKLIIDYFFVGTIKIIYKYVPITITSLEQVLEVDDITANAITYYVAAKIAPHEMAELTNFFEQKYNELKLESRIAQPSQEEVVIDAYWGNNYGNI